MCVSEIMEHVTASIDKFVIEEDAEETEDDSLTDINQGLGLEPGGNPYAE